MKMRQMGAAVASSWAAANCELHSCYTRLDASKEREKERSAAIKPGDVEC
jgi:hypothetical protein